MGDGVGYIEVDAIEEISKQEITEDMAVASGFDNIEELLQVAQHGSGRRVFVVQFHYIDGQITNK